MEKISFCPHPGRDGNHEFSAVEFSTMMASGSLVVYSCIYCGEAIMTVSAVVSEIRRMADLLAVSDHDNTTQCCVRSAAARLRERATEIEEGR